MRVGSVFSGIGGFELGLERAGFDIAFQCEADPRCREVLARHWPGVACYPDVRDLPIDALGSVDVLVGGDPCPVRSLARGDRRTSHPDLSGYFLSVAARLRPRWLVRENVPASDARDFAAVLELLGYGVVAFALDSRDFTAQSRRRQFIVGCPSGERAGFARAVSDAADGDGFVASGRWEETPVAACLTAHPSWMAAEDSYVYEPERGALRLLDTREAESLQGFPRGWTAGFSRSVRRRMLGNAVTVPVAEWIGRRLMNHLQQSTPELQEAA